MGRILLVFRTAWYALISMEAGARRELLRIARSAVERAAAGSDPPLAEPTHPHLRERGAAFVSLHEADGSLRGCVGVTEPDLPLADVVGRMAHAAARRDPRFSPVTPAEVAGLSLEISVLGPLEQVDSVDDIEIGVHGLLVEGRGRRGLLLPQVAVEQGWSKPRFARHASVKAGLAQEDWRAPDVLLFRFRSEVFSEEGSVLASEERSPPVD